MACAEGGRVRSLRTSDLFLEGLKLVERVRLGDDRGSLSRLFCADELGPAGWNKPLVQINHTVTYRSGTVRGMHYQRPPHAEMKLVSCLRGEVWDVVVDVRAGSCTFLRWHAEVLSAENRHAMLIPEGFAHGFQAMCDNVELLYCHSAAYSPTHEAGLHPQDPMLGIDWPMPITALSERDCSHPMLSTEYVGVRI